MKYMDCHSFYDASVKFEDVAKYVSYKLAIKDMTKAIKLNKCHIHLLLCLRLITGVAKSPMGAKVLIPLRVK